MLLGWGKSLFVLCPATEWLWVLNWLHMIKPCDVLLSVVVRKLEIKWESGRKVSPAQADSVLYLSFSSTYQTALPAHLFGVWLVMQQLSLPLSSFFSLSPSLPLSTFYSPACSLTLKCTETQLLPQGWMLDIYRYLDRMQRFSKAGFFWSVDVYTYVQRECMHIRCGSLRPCVSGRRILLVSAWGNASLIISAQISICLHSPLHSSGPYLLPPPFSRSCSHVLDELSRGFPTSSSFVLSEVCLGKRDLSVSLVRTVGVLRERLGHVGASNSAELQQRPALSWVLEWPNGGLFACCMLCVLFDWIRASVVPFEHPPLLSLIYCTNADLLGVCNLSL